MLVCDLFKGGLTIYTSLDPRAAGRGAGGGGQPAREHGRQLGRLHRSHRRGNRPSEGDDARSAVRPRRRGKPGEHRHGRRRNGTPGRIDVQGVHVGRSHRTGHLASDAGRLHLSLKKGQDGAPEDFENFNGNDYRHPDDPKRDGHLVEHRLPAPVELHRPGIHYRDGQPPGRDRPPPCSPCTPQPRAWPTSIRWRWRAPTPRWPAAA